MLLLLNFVSYTSTTLDTNYIGRNITDFTVQEILLGWPNDGRWQDDSLWRGDKYISSFIPNKWRESTTSEIL